MNVYDISRINRDRLESDHYFLCFGTFSVDMKTFNILQNYKYLDEANFTYILTIEHSRQRVIVV